MGEKMVGDLFQGKSLMELKVKSLRVWCSLVILR